VVVVKLNNQQNHGDEPRSNVNVHVVRRIRLVGLSNGELQSHGGQPIE
jgi:hypothetical protein